MLDKSEQNRDDHFAFQNNNSLGKAAVVNREDRLAPSIQKIILLKPIFSSIVLFCCFFSDSEGSKRTANEDREESDYNAEGIFAFRDIQIL